MKGKARVIVKCVPGGYQVTRLEWQSANRKGWTGFSPNATYPTIKDLKAIEWKALVDDGYWPVTFRIK